MASETSGGVRATVRDDPGNELLSALPPVVAREVAGELERVDLDSRDPVYEPGRPMEHVFFPLDAVLSVVADLSEGVAVEVATVGREGMTGAPVLLRAGQSGHRSFTQVPGAALRLNTRRLLELIAANEAFSLLLHRYVHALMTQVAHSVACGRAHTIDQRSARWLLTTHDRVGRDEFPLTQEFLARMLGVRRASVNTSAAMLQRAGFITYSRGRIRVLDRSGLEGASCDCYGFIRGEYGRLLG